MSEASNHDVLLDVQGLEMAFKGVRAVDAVSFEVRRGELFAIIGPNGAGKTSVFNCVSGVYRPTGGRIVFDGADITNMAPHRVAAKGLVRTFQNVEVFPTMSVVDNLLLGRYHRGRTGLITGALWWGRALREEVAERRKVEEIIEFLEIEHIRDKVVGTLSYGQQKRVELGRALASEPKLLLLDEIVAGMNQEETEDIARFILDIRDEFGIAILLIEHDMHLVMDISDRVHVLNFGRTVTEGTPAEVKAHEGVAEAYLGTRRDSPLAEALAS